MNRELDAIRELGLQLAPPAAWRPLEFFNLYRASLAGVFVFLFLWGIAPRSLGHTNFELFRATAVLYFAFSIASGFSIRWRWLDFDAQVFIQVCADIIAITLMMHASGGISSGLGILIVASVAGGAILTEGRIGILFAALATLAVFAGEIYNYVDSPDGDTHYTQIGLLGATFFATALLAYVLASRIRASEALAAKRQIDLANLAELNEHIIQRMQSGILAIDVEEAVRLVNESARSLLGLQEGCEGRRLRAIAPDLTDLLWRWRGGRSQATYMFQPTSGQVEVIASFASLGRGTHGAALIFLEDASSMRQRVQRLKLASLGRLAGSIAHEIRNPLGAISHAGQLLSESPDLGAADQRLLQIIRDNSVRMNEIIENVLQLGRREAAAPETFALGSWLANFVDNFALSQSADRGQIAIDVDPSDLEVRIDPSQFQQVISNLCENGLQHAGDPPRLELRARFNEDIYRPYLDIVDNGKGVPPDKAGNLFEPFFTMRTGGTGLGLYISRELCEGNQGSLNHIPTDTGCCFRITFADPRRKGVPIT